MNNKNNNKKRNSNNNTSQKSTNKNKNIGLSFDDDDDDDNNSNNNNNDDDNEGENEKTSDHHPVVVVVKKKAAAVEAKNDDGELLLSIHNNNNNNNNMESKQLFLMNHIRALQEELRIAQNALQKIEQNTTTTTTTTTNDNNNNNVVVDDVSSKSNNNNNNNNNVNTTPIRTTKNNKKKKNKKKSIPTLQQEQNDSSSGMIPTTTTTSKNNNNHNNNNHNNTMIWNSNNNNNNNNNNNINNNTVLALPTSKRGYLFKWLDRSIGWSGSKWALRFVSIQNGKIMYYSNHYDTSPKYVLSLKHCAVQDDGWKHNKRHKKIISKSSSTSSSNNNNNKKGGQQDPPFDEPGAYFFIFSIYQRNDDDTSSDDDDDNDPKMENTNNRIIVPLLRFSTPSIAEKQQWIYSIRENCMYCDTEEYAQSELLRNIEFEQQQQQQLKMNSVMPEATEGTLPPIYFAPVMQQQKRTTNNTNNNNNGSSVLTKHKQRPSFTKLSSVKDFKAVTKNIDADSIDAKSTRGYPPSKPMHRCSEPSYLSFEEKNYSIYNSYYGSRAPSQPINYRGLFNLGFIILIISNIRILSISITQYGFILSNIIIHHPHTMIHYVMYDLLDTIIYCQNPWEEFPFVFGFLLQLLFINITYCIEKIILSKRIRRSIVRQQQQPLSSSTSKKSNYDDYYDQVYESVGMIFHHINAHCAIIIPMYIVWNYIDNPPVGAVLLLHASITWLKMISYFLANQDYRLAMIALVVTTAAAAGESSGNSNTTTTNNSTFLLSSSERRRRSSSFSSKRNLVQNDTATNNINNNNNNNKQEEQQQKQKEDSSENQIHHNQHHHHQQQQQQQHHHETTLLALVKDLDEEDRNIVYPQNITISNLFYFWCCPSLTYQIAFPKGPPKRRIMYIGSIIIKMIITITLFTFVAAQVVSPVLQNLVHDLEGTGGTYTIQLMAEYWLRLAVANTYLWLLMFYFYFHLYLNFMAEILRFGDRVFYKDWWNSSEVSAFWRLWNLPVHYWLIRHLYFPCIRHRISKTLSTFVVFLFSAIMHEVLVSVPFHMVRPWSFIGMMMQIPLVAITKFLYRKYPGSSIGNIIFWLSFCVVGQPMAILLYTVDYKYKHLLSQEQTK